MEKPTVPTSQYTVYCDHFDSNLNVEFHETEDGVKALFNLSNKDGGIALSLFREDIDILSKVLETMKEYLDERP